MAVFVIDKRKKPLMPCSEKRARKLLAGGRARVHRLMPFSIRLVDRNVSDCELQPIKIKLDPGSKTTGIALVREAETMDVETGEINPTVHVLNLFELTHRGRQISKALTSRRAMRRRRRGNLRYRAPRFLNRTKPAGWLAPSLRHRLETTLAWVKRLQRLVPVTIGSGGLTKYNRARLEIPKTHALDAGWRNGCRNELAEANACDQGDRTWQLSAHPAKCLRLSARLSYPAKTY